MKPVTIPNVFATGPGGNVPVALLDADFTVLAASINDAGTYINYATDSGSANTYAVTFTAGITVSLVNGLPVSFRALNTNTSGSTLNVNGIGAITLLRPDGTPTQAGDIPSGRIVSATYDAVANAFYLNTLGAIPTGSSGSVTYQNPIANSVSRSVQNVLQQILSIKDFGAVCDGITNDTSAWNSAISAISNTNTTLLVPGPSKINASFNVPFNTELWFLDGAKIIGTAGTELIQVQKQIISGPHPVFSTCVPRATVGMTVYPEWFGAIGDGITNDVAAFNSAYSFLQNTGGTIQMGPVSYAINAPIVNNWSKITLAGYGMNITAILQISATMDGIQNFGVAGTPLRNCVFRDFNIMCSAAGSSTGSFGINLQYNAYTRCSNIQVQEFLFGWNHLRATNTQHIGTGASYVSGFTNGFIGFNFNGSGTGTGGNASTTLSNTFVAGNNTLTGSIGYKLTGTYMSDLSWESCATAGTNYGYYFDFTGASFTEDLIIKIPIIDQFTLQGLFIANLPAGGMITIIGGWINPKTATVGTSDIYISSCNGVINISSVEIVSDNNFANSTAINILSSTGIVISNCAIRNHQNHIVMSASGYININNCIFKNDTLTSTTLIKGTGDSRTMVTGNVFIGNATTGISFDGTSSGSGVVGNSFTVANITTRVSNSATGPIGGTDGSTGLNSGY